MRLTKQGGRAAFESPDGEFVYYDFTTGLTTQVMTMEKGLYWSGPNFAAAADGRWILYAHLDQTESDIMLVENFS